jgi:undecaprenyl diphosphate synthase
MALSREIPQLMADGVRIICGRPGGLSDKVRRVWPRPSRDGGQHRLVLNVCFNYGGRWDIAQAARACRAREKPITEANLDRPWRWPMCPTRTC